MVVAASNSNCYAELKSFDDLKLGVKGLVDSGLTKLPRIFHHPPKTLPDLSRPKPQVTVPVIDLSGSRVEVVVHVRQAAAEFGFFQVINHSVPMPLIDHLIKAVRCFNEAPASDKAKYYTRAMGTGVSFSSNVDLFVSKATSWRDTLTVKLGPNLPDFDLIPEICREVSAEWNREVLNLGEIMMGMLSEGLGLSVERLKEMTCLEERVMVAHYYQHCPEPDFTLGPIIGWFSGIKQHDYGDCDLRFGAVEIREVFGWVVEDTGEFGYVGVNEAFDTKL